MMPGPAVPPPAEGAGIETMLPLGRMLIILGALLIVAGLVVSHSSLFSWLRLGRLPGDITIKRPSFSFYFPITSSILVSLILTLILYLFRK
jgi:hypothetical protein